MILSINSDYSALESAKFVNGKSWKHTSSKEYLYVDSEFDNGRSYGTVYDLENEVDANGGLNIHVGRKNGGIMYNYFKTVVKHIDVLELEIGNDAEAGDMLLRLGIENGRGVAYIEIASAGNNSFERFYFYGGKPGSYQSPFISAPSWNQNRDFDLIETLADYFNAVRNFMHGNGTYCGKDEISVEDAYLRFVNKKY